MSDTYSFRSAINGFNRVDVLTYIDNLLKEKAELASKIDSLNEKISGLENEASELKAEIEKAKADVEKAAASTDKCDGCDISKQYEARLGAAMFDAKRFSEILVKEANDKASELFADAFSCADATGAGVQKIAHDIVNINTQFNQSFKSLLDNMNALAKSLDTFKKETKISGKKFNYSTDFSSENASDSFVAGISEARREVNFDDADEYDIRVDV